ncbi:hypothetical protein CRG98_001139 [Punica granatum]|uniref:Retrotransposon gag domain-containing protein n=1 Tax=Punica granatum TaxID=22663 RepID=A0A2I0LCT7_PUNGR|nr:hypothetical protein CRG98_001139 [Punica granatum]
MAQEEQTGIPKEINPPLHAPPQSPATQATLLLNSAGILPAYSGAPLTGAPSPHSRFRYMRRLHRQFKRHHPPTILPASPHSRIMSESSVLELHFSSRARVNNRSRPLGSADSCTRRLHRHHRTNHPCPSIGACTSNPSDRFLPSTAHNPSNHFAPAHEDSRAGSNHVRALPLSVPAPATIYTVPPSTVFPTLSVRVPAPAQTTEPFPFSTLQPHIGLPHQAPPPMNISFPKLDTPIHAAPTAPPTNFLPEAEAEQQRRLKRMEETIRALQANEARPNASYGDSSLFPGMGLPSKGKNCEEYVIHSFQDSLIGSALDWSMSLKAEDIPTWADLSRKFIDQYQYCVEAPPTLLKLSTKEMAQGQRFEDYATKWRAQAAKYVPPISEAGKKLDMGIKLSRMEGPVGKGEGKPFRKTIAGVSSTRGRKGKETIVNVVNPGHPGAQPYSMNFTEYTRICTSHGTLPITLPRSTDLLFNPIGSTSPCSLAIRCPSLYPRSTSNPAL